MTTPECTIIGSGAGGVRFKEVILFADPGESKDF